jgi:hypothetical protein
MNTIRHPHWALFGTSKRGEDAAIAAVPITCPTEPRFNHSFAPAFDCVLSRILSRRPIRCLRAIGVGLVAHETVLLVLTPIRRGASKELVFAPAIVGVLFDIVAKKLVDTRLPARFQVLCDEDMHEQHEMGTNQHLTVNCIIISGGNRWCGTRYAA